MRIVVAIFLLAMACAPTWGQRLTDQRLFYDAAEEYGSMAFSTDGKLLYTAGDGAVILVHELATGKIVGRIEEPEGYTYDLKISPDGKLLASGSLADEEGPGPIRLYDLPSGKLRAVFNEHKKWTRSLAFTPDSRTLFSASDDKTVKLWDLADERCLKTITVSRGHVAVSPSGERVATIGPENTIELRDRESLEVVSRLTGHRSPINALAFSRDSKFLASGGTWKDTAVRIWNVASGELAATLEGRDDPVMSVAFDSTGTLLAATKLNKAVELWDVESKRLLDTKMGGHPGSVAFSPDDRLLAQVHGISDAGSGVYLWRVQSERE